MTQDQGGLSVQPAPQPSFRGAAILLAFGVVLVAGPALAGIVLLSDPNARQIRLFIALAGLAGAGLATLGILLFGDVQPGLLSVLRAVRRGILCGLACAGLIVLQLNQAFSPANIAFLLLVLLIFETIFLARRTDTAA